MLNRIACLGYFGYHNTGDEAILSVLIEQFDNMGLRDKLVIFSGDADLTMQVHAIDAVQNILPTSMSKLIVGALGRNRRNFVKSLWTFLTAEMLIVGGGGLFFDYPFTNIYVLQLLERIKWGKKLGKKVVLLGVGVGPIYRRETSLALRNILRGVDLICVRDEESKGLLIDTGLSESSIHKTEDFAFLLEPPSDERITRILNSENIVKSEERPMVGLALCDSQMEDESYLNAMVELCNHLIESAGAKLCFIPMQTGGGFDDRLGVKAICDRINRQEMVTLIEREYGPKDILGIISRMDFVIGERFHASVFAVISGVPVLGISYMPKVKRLFQKIDRKEWCLDREGLTGAKLADAFTSIWENRGRAPADLSTKVQILKSQSRLNFEFLRQFLNDNLLV